MTRDISFKIVSVLPSLASLSVSEEKGSRYREALKSLAIENSAALPWQEDVKTGSVAVHVMRGCIQFESWWRFSTREFIDDLKAVEADDRFAGHLLLIDSGGGEVYGCHEAWEAIRGCVKPVYAVCREYCCSAAYWIASACRRIYAESPISTVGSIGVMAILEDESEYLKQLGVKQVELYAHGSSRKNREVLDAVAGKAEEYITGRLDPVLSVMLEDIRTGRGIKEDNAALSGDVYYVDDAVKMGLIDGQKSIGEVLEEMMPKPVPPKTDLNNLF